MNLKRTLFAVLTCIASSGALGAEPPAVAHGHAHAGAGAADPSPSSSHSQARQQLLVDGEEALRRGDTARAGHLFEQAAALAHTADAELGLIRTLMQSGEYRHAIAYAAHTAGVHLDETAGAALYAWLLHVGGQARIAAIFLDRARERAPQDAMLERARVLLESAVPVPRAELLDPPARFAPYNAGVDGIPASARAIASGVAIEDGRKVLTSAAALGNARRVWVRNGLGRSSAARFVRTLPDGDLAELELEEPLHDARVSLPARAPYPGSPGFTVEFAAPGDAAPAWPVLRVGFIGRANPDGTGVYALGIDMPAGVRGGPVFDAAGRLIGVAVKGPKGHDKLVSITRVSQASTVDAGEL
ncbi:MAG TPA: trypsin-like peptidase domain-containing protein, partial [Burkholderiales bacterium]|nr:trypsin-like peptidase domain-containing protein [Burkholderiales bacterium]